MKLRYINNVYYYDGPLSDLFIDDGIDLYISYLVSFDSIEWIYVARKLDPSVVTIDKEVGICWPQGYFHTLQKDVDFLVIDRKDFTEGKEWNERHLYYSVEARPITDEERTKYDCDTSPGF